MDKRADDGREEQLDSIMNTKRLRSMSRNMRLRFLIMRILLNKQWKIRKKSEIRRRNKPTGMNERESREEKKKQVQNV